MQFGNVTPPPTLSFPSQSVLIYICLLVLLILILIFITSSIQNFFLQVSFFFTLSPDCYFSNQIARHTLDCQRKYCSLFVTSISNGLQSNSVDFVRKSIFSAYQGVRMCIDFANVSKHIRTHEDMPEEKQKAKKKKKSKGKKKD